MKWKRRQFKGDTIYKYNILDLDNRPIIDVWIVKPKTQYGKFTLHITNGSFLLNLTFDSLKESNDYAKKYLSYLKEQME